MRMKLHIKFTGAEAPYVQKAAQDSGMSVEQFIRAATFFTIREAYKKGQEEQAANGEHNADAGVDSRDTGSTQQSSAADSNALPNQDSTLAAPQ